MNDLTNKETSMAAVTNTADLIFNEKKFLQLEKLATIMAQGKTTIPYHLRNKADCLGVLMQAAQWGMSPFSVAQKTHVVNGQLGYEAQLVNAVITTSNAIEGRFHYEYGGEWEKILGKPCLTSYSDQKKVIKVKGWDDSDEKGLFIKVGAKIKGETKITWGEPVFLSSVDVRNSPLWATHPKQQIAYLAVKMWARLFTPGVILGVYTQDEMQINEELDGDLKGDMQTHIDTHGAKTGDIIDAEVEEATEEPQKKPEPAPTVAEIENAIQAGETPAQMKAIQLLIAKYFSGAKKTKLSKLFRNRVAHLKHTQTMTNASGDFKEAISLLSKAVDRDGIDVAVDFFFGLAKEKKVGTDEMDAFQVESERKATEIEVAEKDSPNDESEGK